MFGGSPTFCYHHYFCYLTAHISRCDNDTLKHTQVILGMHWAPGNTQHIRDKLHASHVENKTINLMKLM